jgi:hypothetical protein
MRVYEQSPGRLLLSGSATLLVLSLLFGLVMLSGAFAQSPVVTQPYTAVLTTNASGTIAVTNTFQEVFVAVNQAATPGTPQANRRRNGCTVQNTGTNPMYVFWGPIANATLANSVKLTAGQAATCNNQGLTLQEQVSITGTATETFYAAQQ